MSTILWNNIQKEIKLRYPDDITAQQALTSEIEEELFVDRKTRWSRILNNSSQPSLPELIVISQKLSLNPDALIESRNRKKDTIKN
jgi:hypothetical protein